MPSYSPPLPLWTDNFVPTPPNVCWTISHSLQKKLGCLSFTGCDETGSMLSRVALWDCSGGRYRFFYWLLKTCAETGSKCLTKQSHNAIPCNTDPGPVHTYSITFENGDFSPSVCKKNTRAQVAYSPVHTKTLKGNSLTYISFTLFYSASKSATLFVRSHKQFDTFCTVRHRIISAFWRGQTILDQQYRKAAIPDKVGSFSFSDKKWREFHI